MEISGKHKQIIYTIFAASGCSALIYEILWTKYLSLTFGNTMIAVSVVAATFMAGLAIGSFLLGRYVDREANLLKVYCLLEFGIALTALLFAPALGVVEHLYQAVEKLFSQPLDFTRVRAANLIQLSA